MVIAAKKATLDPSGHQIRFSDVSFGIVLSRDVYRGTEAVIDVSEPLKILENLAAAQLLRINIREKESTIVLTGRGEAVEKGSVPLEVAAAIPVKGVNSVNVRFDIDIAPSTPIEKLVPASPKDSNKRKALLLDNLKDAPEISIEAPIAKDANKQQALTAAAN